MMKVKVLKAFCIGNGEDVEAGDEVELPNHIGRQWIWKGRAELVSEDDEDVQNADPVITTGDPKPAGTAKKSAKKAKE